MQDADANWVKNRSNRSGGIRRNLLRFPAVSRGDVSQATATGIPSGPNNPNETMNSSEFLNEEESRRLDLQSEVARVNDRCQRLSESPQIEELARTYLAGGRIYYNTGNLFQLQAARLELQVIEKAAEIQAARTQTCADLAAQEKRAEQIAQRTTIAAELAAGAERLAELADKLHEAADESCTADSLVDRSNLSPAALEIVGKLLDQQADSNVIRMNRAA